MMSRLARRWWVRCFAGVLASSLWTCAAFAQADATARDAAASVEFAEKTEVAMYQSKGISGRGPGMLKKTFAENDRFDLVVITLDDIQEGVLANHRILIVPGGTSRTIGRALGDSGREAIREFVRSGGIYVGICAGCYLSTSEYPWSLHLLPAKVVDPRNSYRGRAKLRLEPSRTGRDWLRRDDLEPKVVYHNGPVLEPIADAESLLIPLAIYREEITRKGAEEGLMIDTPAIAASAYGKGWAIGISPHPEQTEGLQDVVPSLIRWALENPPAD